MTHIKWAERKGVSGCSAHHVRIGGGCLNCGWGVPPYRKPTIAERKAHLIALGFEFPKETTDGK